ncbi:MAG: type II toxin-antitoxin system VapC family toxin [Candidatus Cloacimonetes bacterium]|nr:type II toxin-antitoxin system VapC family toxin [Candidatus Cloacimonadota bacterium]
MKYLLDTHTLIWCFTEFESLSKNVVDIISDPEKTKFISIVSFFEITIKLKIDKLNIGISLDDLFKLAKNRNFVMLPIKQKHLNVYLTQISFHKDPFDRLLVASAKSENLVLITSDKDIHQYDVDWIW